ncbi:family 20 glycosylhydrolase [Pleomorphovibrio marinus]|uniref:family 20 glycosylhydrolase n=1 Tax=Pleomorphovibrio marinus TaxID=2164132 RepID=UPI001E57F7D7|nr:family 20 glycosylhydrolase [Pleomorphovibrio marinus]
MRTLSEKMKLLLSSLFLFLSFTSFSQDLPVKGFAIAAPNSDGLDRFVKFMEEELGPRGINTLVLRVDFNYAFQSHPELQDENPLTKGDVDKIKMAAKKHGIKVVPQINLLGHQSWAGTLGNLLKEYPEFDETPHVKMPENYEWPNEDGLYCKSYCPLHPEVHEVVFALVDELCEAFETSDFHAGMDEVFFIGDDKCPRCGGLDKAELFAGEVTKIQNHLDLQGRRLWIWGDRLIDGKRTGIGMWEGSMNNTHRAIDLIPKEVMICDWHYNSPIQTPVIFAAKGLDVISCSWNKPQVGVQQLEDMVTFRNHNTSEMKDRFQGVMVTVWSGADVFLDGLEKYLADPSAEKEVDQPWVTFVEVFEKENFVGLIW